MEENSDRYRWMMKKANHAYSGKNHGIFNEKHGTWKKQFGLSEKEVRT